MHSPETQPLLVFVFTGGRLCPGEHSLGHQGHQIKVDPVGEGGWSVVILGGHLLLYLAEQLRMTLLPLARVKAKKVLPTITNIKIWLCKQILLQYAICNKNGNFKDKNAHHLFMDNI